MVLPTPQVNSCELGCSITNFFLSLRLGVVALDQFYYPAGLILIKLLKLSEFVFFYIKVIFYAEVVQPGPVNVSSIS